MYRKESKEQLRFENFHIPFGGHLRKENRWVKIAELIPWEELEEKYAEQFETCQVSCVLKYGLLLYLLAKS